MADLPDYKKGLSAYRIGFSIGLVIGTSACILIGKAIWIFPIFFGLLGGAIGFRLQIRKDERTNK